MNKLFQRLRLVWSIILYLLVIIYTLVFPTTASWFIFYAFTLWMVSAFLSTRQTYHLTSTKKSKNDDHSLSLTFTIQNKRRHPFFLSYVKLSLAFDGIRETYESSLFFSRQIEGTFQSIALPRGHHDTLSLDIDGTGLYGIWTRHSHLVVPINVDIFPKALKKTERQRLMHSLSPYFTETSRSLNHDYYMNEIRTYQTRDALSGIDWKTSLKRGQWMVREYETEEDAPVDLYFIGFDTPSFEDLLSLCYTLLHELKAGQKVNLFLIGQFEKDLSVQYSEDRFLTIQPGSNKQRLITLCQSSFTAHSKKIIVKSKDVPMPVPLDSPLSYRFIDEDTFLQVKGGDADHADAKQ